MAYNTTNADGGLGQFAVGTFVADATGTQTLTFVSSSGPNVFINALELREIPSTVPEPSSLVLCGLAGVIGSAYAWRRRKPAAMA